jgi:HAD superfamily hydrolase (TIGR01662 family)
VIKAYLFDFNATLVHSPAWMELEIRTLPEAAFGHLAGQGHITPLSQAALSRARAVFQQCRQRADESGRETSHVDDLRTMVSTLQLAERLPEAVVEETVRTLHRALVAQATLIAGAAETIRLLRGQGQRLAIVSNAAYAPYLRWTLQQFGLYEAFEQITVSADVGVRKPDPEIFAIALEEMRLRPAEAVYVGDDFGKDVVGAKSAGLRAIWYRPPGASWPDGQKVVADAVVSELLQIPLLARRWQAGLD